MRIAALSDVHGNLAALEAVLADIEDTKPDRIVVAGDLVALGPQPTETLARLMAIPNVVAIRGNTERYLADPDEAPRRTGSPDYSEDWIASFWWTRQRLAPDELRALETLPILAQIDDCLVVHGSLSGDEEGLLPEVESVRQREKADWARLLICGHTHRPFFKQLDGVMVVNDGSVGWPLDGDPRPSYAIIDHEPNEGAEVSIRRVDYDRSRAIQELRRRDVPWRWVPIQMLETGVFPHRADYSRD
ncbi:MAG: metallophosphoesterase family protein [Chloroflexota bacterium]